MQVFPTMRPFLVLSRLSWPVQALLVCGAFLLVGIAVVGDYSAGIEAPYQRLTAARNLAFITGAADRLDGFNKETDKYYGVVFELPLLLLERGVGVEDSRSLYLLRHLVTHGFFLVGGLCCSLLVYRLSHSRAAALLALLVFVVQPRLYAHSFFNSKDLPFLSMFMVTLYVTHRAFRTETVGAFVLCGMCVGFLTNLRIMGVMVYPAVLALRGLDLGQARRGERTHVLVTGAVFAVVGPGTLYGLSPYLWADPFEFVRALELLAHHPLQVRHLFQGRLVEPHHLPAHYLPTWMVISTPLVTLLGSVLGCLRVCLRSGLHPRAALGNTDLRFGLLLVACVILPVLAIITIGSHLYDDWRHMYFLHAPLCCLAGLGWQWVGGRRREVAAGVSLLAGGGVVVAGVDLVRLHPHQQVYFNEVMDRTTPEYLRNAYLLDPWRISCRAGLEFLRRRYPDTTVYLRDSKEIARGRQTLSQADRARFVLVGGDEAADFRISCGMKLQRSRKLSLENVVYVHKVYNSTLVTVRGVVTVPERARRQAHRTDSYAWITSGQLVAHGRFDLYTYPGVRMLGYARRGCTEPETRAPFFVHVFPVDAEALPGPRRRYGYDNLDFRFAVRGWQVGGRCWVGVVLPAYAIAYIRTGQHNTRERLWETELEGPLP